MASATSSMHASSRAESRSVLNVRLRSSMTTSANRCWTSRIRLDALGQRRTCPVDPGALLHRLLHLVAERGEALAATRFAQDLAARAAAARLSPAADAAALVAGACDGVLGGRPAGARPEHEQLRQRVGSEAIGAVDADAGDFTCSVQPGQRRRAIHVRVYAAHHVVHDRTHGDQILDRIQVLVLLAQLADEGDLRVDLLLTEMPEIEVHDGAIRRIDRATLLELLHERLRQAIARSQLHRPQHRVRLRRAQLVVLQIAVAVLVDQVSALGARRFGDEDAREGEARSDGPARTPCP